VLKALPLKLGWTTLRISPCDNKSMRSSKLKAHQDRGLLVDRAQLGIYNCVIILL
jgi:hypothetical protein